ncbi:MAG: hypothetical protein SGPRY_003064, partial [Prymnesium sp.]
MVLSRRAVLAPLVASSSGGSRLLASVLPALSMAPPHTPLIRADQAAQMVHQRVLEKPALAGTLLRLAFHDCITRDQGEGGSNGSILWELDLRENRHLSVAVEALMPIHTTIGGSFADLVAIAGAAAVATAGGPKIPIERIGIGRVDSTQPDPMRLARPIGERGCPPKPKECRGAVRSALPEPGLDTDGIRRFFSRVGFDERETVALCGAHTLGRHASLLGVSAACLRQKQGLTDDCIESGRRLPFVSGDPDEFSASYFKRLLEWYDQSLAPDAAYFIPTDVVLTLDARYYKIVKEFAKDESSFFKAFTSAYVKLVHIGFKGDD